MNGLLVTFLFAFLTIFKRSIATQASSCNAFRSNLGTYLKGHVFKTSSVSGLQQCSASCVCHPACKSSNYVFANQTCQLNKADKFDFPHDLVPREGFSYSGWKYKEPDMIYKSCADIKKNITCVKSGYYNVSVRGKTRQVYCDMENFGGGWTLVASINASSNEHLQSAENNCYNPFLCVKHSTSNIAARKLADEDIIDLASAEGTFRVEKLGSTTVTAFYKLPGGSEHFSSSCYSESCARIIISHHYPYKWESNCKGVDIGYKIYYYVFDSHDEVDPECSEVVWRSSLYHTGRVLYGYKVNGGTGIYSKTEGLLFVR